MNFEIKKGPDGQTVLSLRPQTDEEIGLVRGLIPSSDPPTKINVTLVDERTNKIEITRELVPVVVIDSTPVTPQAGAEDGESTGTGVVVDAEGVREKFKKLTRQQLMTHLAENNIKHETDANKETLLNLAVTAELSPKE